MTKRTEIYICNGAAGSGQSNTKTHHNLMVDLRILQVYVLNVGRRLQFPSHQGSITRAKGNVSQTEKEVKKVCVEIQKCEES